MAKTRPPQRTTLGRCLERRGATFTFRRALPKDLQAASGIREFVRALPTDDLRDAKRLRDTLIQALDVAWSAARRDLEAGTWEAENLGPRDVVNHYQDEAVDFLHHELAQREERLAEAMRFRRPGERPAAIAENAAASSLVEALASVLGGNGGLADAIGAAVAKALEEHRARAASSTPASSPPRPSPPFGQLVEDHLVDQRGAWSVTTRGQRERELRELATTVGADKPAREVAAADVDVWRRKLAKDGNGPGTVRRKLAGASSLFAWALDLGHVDVNPVSAAKRVAARATSKREARKAAHEERAAFTDEELRLLFATDFANADYHDRNPTAKVTRVLGPILMLLGGFRPNELGWARPEDVVSLEGRLCLRVEGYETDEHPTGRYLPKAGDGRTVPLHPAVEPIVRQLVEARRGLPFLLPGAATTARGERTNPISKPFNDRVAALDLKDDGRERLAATARGRLSAYSLRHTFASNLQRAGVAEEVIAELLGHARHSMTARYTKRVDVARLAAAVDLLDAGPVEALLRRLAKVPPPRRPRCPQKVPSAAHS